MTQTPSTPERPSQLKSRLILLLIAVMFLGSFFIAFALRMSGWTPGQGRNFGELIAPPTDLSMLSLRTADGSAYPWAPLEDRWQLVVHAPKDCGHRCEALYNTLYRVWYTRGRHAARIDVLWFGEVPANRDPAQWSAFRPMQDHAALLSALRLVESDKGVPVYLIDPKGFLMMQYPAGFDPSGLRKDLGKLVK